MARKIVNIEEWKQEHTTKHYMLFNITDCKDGEGEPVIRSNNPKAFNGFIREQEYHNQKYCVVNGAVED